MKTAEEIALDYGLCNCDEAYRKRRISAPNCPFHAFAVVEAMEEYVYQFQPKWIKINSPADLPKYDTDFWVRIAAPNALEGVYYIELLSKVDKFTRRFITHYAPIIKPQPPKED